MLFENTKIFYFVEKSELILRYSIVDICCHKIVLVIYFQL